MKNKYPFKRSFYYVAEKAISENSVTFLLGPRRCGKTVCLKQLMDKFSSDNDFEEVIFVDAQKDLISILDKSLFIGDVKKAVEKNEKKLFLIDETTFLNFPDYSLNEVQDAFTSLDNTNTKVVFTGSPSRALEYWGRHALAEEAAFVRTDFLSYREWLAFKGIIEVSEKTYEQFIRGTREFYSDFKGTREYLQGCLENTDASNLNSEELIPNNSCYTLDADILLDVLYASLASSLNRESSFLKLSRLQETYLSERYRSYQKMNSYQLKETLQFLSNCGLISISYVSSSFDAKPDIVRELLFKLNDLPEREIFDNLDISIKYPMFYVDMLESIENMAI